MSEHAKRRNDAKEKILKTSAELFYEKGYNRTSMREIASEAQVSLALVTYHLKTKETLAANVINRYTSEVAFFFEKHKTAFPDEFCYFVVMNWMALRIFYEDQKLMRFYTEMHVIDLFNRRIENFFQWIEFIHQHSNAPLNENEIKIAITTANAVERGLLLGKKENTIQISFDTILEKFLDVLLQNLQLPWSTKERDLLIARKVFQDTKDKFAFSHLYKTSVEE